MRQEATTDPEKMARDVRFPLLLLLLLLFGLLCPLCAVPPGFTNFQWFALQHIQPNPLPCDRAMSGINQHLLVCKPLNTFLHDSPQNVINVCTLPNTQCKNCRNNCHRSVSPVSVTDCRLTGGTPPNCRYRTRARVTNFAVACAPPQRGDPPAPLVPVHLD